MIKELAITGLAIIDRLEMSLGPGLSCLTGETGAGKSILVDAISVVLGGKAHPSLVRDGGEATVQAAFDISKLPELKSRLCELGLEGGDGGEELIIRRVISPAGRGKVYINSSIVSVATLQEVGDFLVDIHGQHDHQSLLKAETHLDLLDAYCNLTGGVEGYRAAYDSLNGLKRRREELSGKGRERAQRVDLLRFQKREIDDASLQLSEEEALLAERSRLVHADRLKSLALAAQDLLRDSETPALTLLGEAVKAVREITALAPEGAECQRLLESAFVSVGEACSYLRDFGDSLEADPGRLDHVEGRLDLISKLKKKYGETVTEVLEYREKAVEELASLEGSDEELASLEAKIMEAGADVLALAEGLGRARRQGAKGLSAKAEAELAGLGMEKAAFEVAFGAPHEPGPKGMDRVEFLISANPGEPVRPLGRVASGGELSRVMLALKVILAEADRVPTLIFDEVDSGVGGQTAGAVGRKLREAALGRQVLCITHLPRIASLAAEHYKVEKTVEGGRTVARVVRLDKEGRVREVARMLGGDEDSRTASAHAEELVKQGESYG